MNERMNESLFKHKILAAMKLISIEPCILERSKS